MVEKKSGPSFGNNTYLTPKKKEDWFIPADTIILTHILEWLGSGCGGEERRVRAEIHSQGGFRPDLEAVSATKKASAALRSSRLFLLLHPPAFLSTAPAHISPHSNPYSSPYTNIQEQGSVQTKWRLKHYLLHVFKLRGQDTPGANITESPGGEVCGQRASHCLNWSSLWRAAAPDSQAL